MFTKILIANRGEIAVRIIRTCRDIGILTVALYHAADRGSLHVRLADECIELNSPLDFTNQELIIQLAQSVHAQAIHPGYGFLAERASFIHACTAAGITVIGPPAEVVELATNKVLALEKVRAAGFSVVEYSALQGSRSSGDRLPGSEEPLAQSDCPELAQIIAAAKETAVKMGLPVVVKPRFGGRGRGEKLIHSIDRLGEDRLGEDRQGDPRLGEIISAAQNESQVYYGDPGLYMEKVLPGVHTVNVQILGDRYGNLIHLGECEGSIRVGNQKYLDETPAPFLSGAQRLELWKSALQIARVLNYQNAGGVEFIITQAGEALFSEIKARIQIDHPLAEITNRIDLVSEQIRVAAGERLRFRQEDVHLNTCAMACRINAVDPWRNFLPSSGRFAVAHLPTGIGVRVDTYLYSGCDVPPDYDPLVAKLVVCGNDRSNCLQRMNRALEEFKLIGPLTNLPTLQRILRHPEVINGTYTGDFTVPPLDLVHTPLNSSSVPDTHLRDMAVAAAIFYLRRMQAASPSLPERLSTGWHRAGRQLPRL